MLQTVTSLEHYALACLAVHNPLQIEDFFAGVGKGWKIGSYVRAPNLWPANTAETLFSVEERTIVRTRLDAVIATILFFTVFLFWAPGNGQDMKALHWVNKGGPSGLQMHLAWGLAPGFGD